MGTLSWTLKILALNGALMTALLAATPGRTRANAVRAVLAEDRAWVATLLRPGALTDGTALNYGMGVETAPVGGAPAVSHAGSTGSYRAWLGLFPTERLSIALLCNSGAVNTEDLGPEVAARFLPPPASPASLAKTATTAPAELAGSYRNLANDAVVEAKIDASGLHLNGGAGFALVAHDRLAAADGRRTATIRRSANGAVEALVVTRIANAPSTLARVALWTPTAAELRRLAGDYVSVEIDGVQRIEATGAGLVWRDPSGAAHPLQPIYRDAFDAPDVSWTLRFRRSAKGAPMLDLSITRARRIAFRRTTAARTGPLGFPHKSGGRRASRR